MSKKIRLQRYITVLDYFSGNVYQEDLTKHFTDEEFEKGIDGEKFLDEQGFEINNICYMVHENKDIHKF